MSLYESASLSGPPSASVLPPLPPFCLPPGCWPLFCRGLSACCLPAICLPSLFLACFRLWPDCWPLESLSDLELLVVLSLEEFDGFWFGFSSWSIRRSTYCKILRWACLVFSH